MNKLAYYFHLSLAYIKSHKKANLLLFFVVLLSTFLLTTAFIIKDSYDYYGENLTIRQLGNWEIRFNPISLSDYPQINDAIEIKAYENNFSTDNDMVGYSEVSGFNHLGISLIDGKYPTTNQQIIIPQAYAKSQKLKIGNKVTLEVNGNKESYDVMGIYQANREGYQQMIYAHMDKIDLDNLQFIYANVKNEYVNSINNIISQPYSGIDVNDPLYQKHHQEDNFTMLYKGFIILLIICIFIFIYQSFKAYLNDRKKELDQLQIMGATRGIRFVILFNELFLINAIFFIIAFMLSIFIWYILLKGGGVILTNILGLSQLLDFYLSFSHLIMIILIVLGLFLVSFIMLFIYGNRKGKPHYFKRKLNLYRLPVVLEQALVDIIRKAHGLYLVIIISMVACFSLSAQVIVESWIDYSNQYYQTYRQEEGDLYASASLFNLNKQDVIKLMQDWQDTLEKAQESYAIKYQINAKLLDEFNSLENAFYTIDDDRYLALLKKHHLENEQLIVIGASNEKCNLHIAMTNLHGEVMTDFKEEAIVINDDEYLNMFANEGNLVIVSRDKLTSWISHCPDYFIDAKMIVNGDNASVLASYLEDNNLLNEVNNYYINDNLQAYQQMVKDNQAIRLFVYVFGIGLIIIGLLIIYESIKQYIMQRKHDLFLYTVWGMSDSQKEKMFIIENLILLAIAIVISMILEVAIFMGIKYVLLMNLDLNKWLLFGLIDYLVLVIIVVLMNKLAIKIQIKEN